MADLLNEEPPSVTLSRTRLRAVGLWACAVVLLMGGASGSSQAQVNAAYLVADLDDDDGNRVADAFQGQAIPPGDLKPIPPAWLVGAESVRVRGRAARLVRGGTPLPHNASSAPAPDLAIQGISVGEASLRISRNGELLALPLTVVGLRFLDGDNHTLRPEADDVSISRRITNDGSLPPGDGHALRSADQHDIRAELIAPALGGLSQVVTLIPHGQSGHQDTVGRALPLRAKRGQPRGTFRTRYVRLVADRIDLQAPGAQGQLLGASLLDDLQLQWKAPDGSVLSQEIRVGRRSDDPHGPQALRATLLVHVLRTHPGGPPVLGLDDESATRIAREQVRSASQVWAQCGIAFTPESDVEVRIEPPPPPCLLSVANGDGLPARGNGAIMFRADGQTIGPVLTRPGASPTDTAMEVARALQAARFEVVVTRNPRTQYGAQGSADLVVRRGDGAPATLTPVPDVPISTDAQQRLKIGHVDLRDGLREFDNMNAQAGTLEERALLKTLADSDPTTIDVFLLNHFTAGTRQGEAFIEASGGPLINMVVVDRNGLSQRDNAWALAHELGHVLLDDPLHPDNVGPDRPWLLMDADSSRGSVYGPKRLTTSECVRAVYESGPDAVPALLKPED